MTARGPVPPAPSRGRARGARLLARGWLREGRRWNMGSAIVLASTLIAMVGTAGVLDGTRTETLDRVADFYTGDLRITPFRTGAIPGGFFYRNGTSATDGQDPVAVFAAAGVTVSPRIEAQFVMSRVGILSNAIDTFGNQGQFPIETPGQSGEDANRTLAVGGLIGLEEGDPASSRIKQHLVAGRMPQPTTDGTLEVVMSVRRLEGFLTPDEREGLSSPPPLATLCHRDEIVKSTPCEITSGQTRRHAILRGDLVRKSVDIVGLFHTGVDALDQTTLVAPAGGVRELLGYSAKERIDNVLIVTAGDPGRAKATADEEKWASEDVTSFAGAYVGQMIAVLGMVVLIVGALLFLLPTFLVSHGIARQLALQRRELAVCTAIGVPDKVLRRGVLLQVLRIGMIGAGIAAVVCLVFVLFLPPLLGATTVMPLPPGFELSLTTAVGATCVLLLSLAIGWWMGLRSRGRLPLTAQLRAG